MAYEIVVQLSPVARQTLEDESSALVRATREFGVVLEALGAGSGTADAGEYYVAQVEDHRTAEQLVSRIRSLHGVEAAYVKPPGELPARM